VRLQGKVQPTIRGCKLTGNKKVGVILDGTMEGVLENCDISAGEGSGFTIANLPKATIKRSAIHDNKTIGGVLRAGAAMEVAMDGVKVTGNAKSGLEIGAWVAQASCKAALTSCTLSDNAGDGFLVTSTGTVDLKLAGCTMESNGARGLLFRSPGSLTVEGSVAGKNKTDGIAVMVGGNGSPKAEVAVSKCAFKANGGVGLLCFGKFDFSSVVADCTFEANGAGGLVGSLERGYKGSMKLSNVTAAGNRFGAVSCGPDVALQANQCVFSGTGVSANCPASVVMADTRFEEVSGVGALRIEGAAGSREQTALVEMTRCSMAAGSDAHGGIAIGGLTSAQVRVSKSSIAGYRDAVVVATDKGCLSRIDIRDTSLLVGPLGNNLVKVQDCPVLGFLPMMEDPNSMPSVLEYFSEKCSAVLTNCQAGSSAGGAWNATSKGASLFRVPVVMPGFVRSDGLLLSPPLAEAAMSSQTIARVESLKKIGFADWEKEKTPQVDPATLGAIATSFAAQARVKSHPELVAAALKYLRAHPDEVVSCRLFQGAIGPSVAFLDDEDTNLLAMIVKDAPNSVLADTVCSELTAQSAYWPSTASSREVFRSVCQASPGTVAGAYAEALANDQIPLDQKCQKAWGAYDLVEQKFPEVRRRLAMTAVEGEGGKRTIERWDTFIRCCAVVDNCLSQAGSWHRLGADDLAEQYLQLARGAALNVYPMLPANLYLPEELSRAFRIGKEAFPEAPLMSPADIVSAEKSGHPGPAGEAVRKRLDDYRKVMPQALYFHPSFCEFAGISAPVDAKKLVADRFLKEITLVLQSEDSSPAVGLDEAKADLGADGVPKNLLAYLTALEKDILPSLLVNERNDLLARLEAAVPNKSVGTPPVQEAYAQAMSRCYQAAKNIAKVTEEQERLVEVATSGEAKVAALDRLAAMYETQWNLPDRAIGALRKIPTASDDFDTKANARLKISKILYKEKRYQEVTHELTVLISELPKKYETTTRKKYDLSPVHTMLAMAYLGDGSYEDSRKELATVVAEDEGKNREQCLYLTGYSYICEQKYADAVKPFHELVEKYPDGDFAKKAQDFLAKLEKVAAPPAAQ
jgi:tetratricopeptide (TPR) repeat protein